MRPLSGQSRYQPRSKIPADQLIARRVGNGFGKSTRSLSRPIARSPQFNFGGSSSLRSVRDAASMDARSLEACIGLRLKLREHLPIASFELSENFMDPRKHSTDNLDHLAP
jgi:hypothetical protein